MIQHVVAILVLAATAAAPLCLDGLGIGGKVECDAASFAPLHNAVCRAHVPRAVVYPYTNDDVATTLRYAANRSIRISYRGGGHSYTCKSRLPDSIQLDMRYFDGIEVDEARGEVTVGTGVVFSELLRVIRPAERTIAHGGCLSVGVAGFFLHGGIHAPATRLIGLGNETVTAMTVVLANGTVAHLSAATPHGGLWDAMRTAGSSFGIATSLTVRFLEEPEATSFVFLVSMDEAQFAAVGPRFVKRTRDDGNLAVVTMDGGGPQRLLRGLREELDPSIYTLQISVRNNQGRLLDAWAVQYARAYAYLISEMPLAAAWSAVYLPSVVQDQSIAYDATGGGWVSTFLCLDPECPLERIILHLSKHFREYAYTDATQACWQVYSSTTSFHDKVCYEYNCPDMAVFHRELERLDRDVKEMCPSWIRSINVPSFHATHGSEYWADYEELAALRDIWDPDVILNPLAGAA